MATVHLEQQNPKVSLTRDDHGDGHRGQHEHEEQPETRAADAALLRRLRHLRAPAAETLKTFLLRVPPVTSERNVFQCGALHQITRTWSKDVSLICLFSAFSVR